MGTKASSPNNAWSEPGLLHLCFQPLFAGATAVHRPLTHGQTSPMGFLPPPLRSSSQKYLWIVWFNQAENKPNCCSRFFPSLSPCSSTSSSMSPFSGWRAQSGACNIYAALPFGRRSAANATALSPRCLCPSLCTITCCWSPKESCFEEPRGAGQGLRPALPSLGIPRHGAAQQHPFLPAE